MAHDHDLYTLLTDSAVQRRDLPALDRYASRLEELAGRDGHRLYQAVAHRALGVAARLRGDLPTAERRLKASIGIFEEMGTRWQKGITLLEIAELDQSRSDLASRGQHLEQALALFNETGAKPDANRVKQILNANGLI
jgi:hypothetical protein